ncbi:MAG: hypothetical protein ACTSYQ_01030, partial [Candidatus Odinarchaeia archaeon]
MRKKIRKSAFIILPLMLTILLPFFIFDIPLASAQPSGIYTGSHNSAETVQWAPSLYDKWNYRAKINITEPGISDRINEPVNLFLDLPNNAALDGLFRLMFFNGTDWVDVPVQIWNKTLQGSYVDSATFTFLVNITKSASNIYYLYYTNDPSASMSVNYYNYVQAINGTFTDPNVVSYNYTTIKAQNYTAKLAWEYGFLVDFIINDKDVIGELYRSNLAVEVGDIVDCNNKWREEVRNLYRGKDKAQLINFTSGPVFVQISTHKQTTYRGNLEINRTWTFYPDFWTLKTVVKLNPGDSQKIIVYSRMFHNGSKTYISSIEQDDDVID